MHLSFQAVAILQSCNSPAPAEEEEADYSRGEWQSLSLTSPLIQAKGPGGISDLKPVLVCAL